MRRFFCLLFLLIATSISLVYAKHSKKSPELLVKRGAENELGRLELDGFRKLREAEIDSRILSTGSPGTSLNGRWEGSSFFTGAISYTHAIELTTKAVERVDYRKIQRMSLGQILAVSDASRSFLESLSERSRMLKEHNGGDYAHNHFYSVLYDLYNALEALDQRIERFLQ